MIKNIIRKLIQGLRSVTPLFFRRKIGPFFAYCSYVWRVYIVHDRNVPNVLSIMETIDLIKSRECSVIRFGDGEMSLIDNTDLAFQQKNETMVSRLKEVMQSDDDKLLICVPRIWGRLDEFSKKSFWFILHHLFRYGYLWRSLLPAGRIYGDAYLTRPYLAYRDNSDCAEIFLNLFSVWKNKDVVLIEGEKSRLGVGNDMFDGVSSLKRILCPAENAYSKYEQIKAEALKISRDKLVLVSLGPTAKILADDMFKLGYRVLDIGHIDMEYEMFLRKEDEIVKVPYKYFNEIGERTPEECSDEKYLSQIMAKII